jgi:hypothetical protein
VRAAVEGGGRREVHVVVDVDVHLLGGLLEPVLLGLLLAHVMHDGVELSGQVDALGHARQQTAIHHERLHLAPCKPRPHTCA